MSGQEQEGYQKVIAVTPYIKVKRREDNGRFRSGRRPNRKSDW